MFLVLVAVGYSLVRGSMLRYTAVGARSQETSIWCPGSNVSFFSEIDPTLLPVEESELVLLLSRVSYGTRFSYCSSRFSYCSGVSKKKQGLLTAGAHCIHVVGFDYWCGVEHLGQSVGF